MSIPSQNPVPSPWDDETITEALGIAVAVSTQGQLDDDCGLVDDANMDLVFQELPTRARTTQNNHARGWALWDTFAKLQKVKPIDKLGDDDVSSKPFQGWVRSFVTFLLEYQDKYGQHYKPKTVVQYLSSFKKALAIKFPKVTQLKEGHEDANWYQECYAAAVRQSHLRCAKRGEASTNVKLSIQHVLLDKIMKELLNDKPPDSLPNYRPPYEDLAVINTLYHAIGRSSEAPLTTFNKMRWDPAEECLWCVWSEVKVATHEVELCFFSNTLERGYRTDFHTVTAMHIITSGSMLDQVQGGWLFPSYTEDNGRAKTYASSHVTDILRRLVPRNIGVEPDHASHSLRKGPMDDLALHPRCPHLAAFRRGAWEFPLDCAAVLYITTNMLVIVAGKALCGYAEPRQKVSAPTLDAIDDPELRNRFETLCESLFLFTHHSLGGRTVAVGSLHQWARTMTASLVMYYDDIRADSTLKDENPVIKVIIGAAYKCNITVDVLRQCSLVIRNRFKSDNQRNAICAGDLDTDNLQRRMEYLSSHMGDLTSALQYGFKQATAQLAAVQNTLQQQISSVAGQVSSLSGRIDQMQGNQQQMFAMIQAICHAVLPPGAATNPRFLAPMSPLFVGAGSVGTASDDSSQSSAPSALWAHETSSPSCADTAAKPESPVKKNFAQCLDWQVTTLLVNVTIDNVNLHDKDTYPYGLDRTITSRGQIKNKAKTVLALLQSTAPQGLWDELHQLKFKLARERDPTVVLQIEHRVREVSRMLVRSLHDRLFGHCLANVWKENRKVKSFTNITVHQMYDTYAKQKGKKSPSPLYLLGENPRVLGNDPPPEGK